MEHVFNKAGMAKIKNTAAHKKKGGEDEHVRLQLQGDPQFLNVTSDILQSFSLFLFPQTEALSLLIVLS